MFIIKLIRKIVKILRGGAGRKEILLGVLSGVLLGMIPGFNLTLILGIWLMLLLNANIAFVLLGLAIGKIACLALAPVTFQLGYLIIHNIGLEGLFRFLNNTPVLALMDLDVYCLVGGVPIAIVLGMVLGKLLASVVTKVRRQMVKAGEKESLQKIGQNTIIRIFMRVAFGKQKVSTQDVLDKKSSLFRKSGIILACTTLALVIAAEFFLLDYMVKAGVTSSISSVTGAEVNLAEARLSLADGKLELKGLQVTNPDKPTHNTMQIESLVADVSMSDLLRKSYAIDLLKGDDLQLDVLRAKPGEVYTKEAVVEDTTSEEEAETGEEGKSLDDYLEQAKSYQKYAKKVKAYLDERKRNADAIEKGEQPEPVKEESVADAQQIGYLKVKADNLVIDRPTWLIRRVEIDNVAICKGYPKQEIVATEICSHPELNKKSSTIVVTPVGGKSPVAKVALRFDDPQSNHELLVNVPEMPLGEHMKMSKQVPLDIKDGKMDAKISGEFSADELNLPFSILVRDLKANAKAGEQVMGMDAATANEVFSTLEQIEIVGSFEGALLSPKVNVDYDRLMSTVQGALLKAGKKALANRANAEMEKAEAMVKDKVDEELGKMKKSVDAEIKDKLGDSLKGFGFGSDSEVKADEKKDDEKKSGDFLKKLF